MFPTRSKVPIFGCSGNRPRTTKELRTDKIRKMRATFRFRVFCIFACYLTTQIYNIRNSDINLIVAVPWLRRLVAAFSPRRPGCAPASFLVGFEVDKMALRLFSPSSSVLPCRYHSTVAVHTYISSG
jgi:hypothetical protein